MEFKIYYLRWKPFARKYGNNKLTQQIVLPEVRDLVLDKDFYLFMCSNTTDTDNIEEFLESMFSLFNSDENPLSNPDKQKEIIDNECHTSMSVGDLISFKDKLFVVGTMGFLEITDSQIIERFAN
jgi:GH43 family beta-xylosidase